MGEGPRPCAGEGRGAAVEGAARPGSRRPARWGRRRGPGRPGRPSGDGRGNGSLRRRSRRCRRCPGPAAVARRPLLPWPPLSRAPSPGDSARETREGDEGTPKTNRASHHPPEQDPPIKTSEGTRGGGSTQQRRSPGCRCPSKVRRPLLGSRVHSLCTDLLRPRSPGPQRLLCSLQHILHALYTFHVHLRPPNVHQLSTLSLNPPPKYIYPWTPSQPLLNLQHKHLHIPSSNSKHTWVPSP